MDKLLDEIVMNRTSEALEDELEKLGTGKTERNYRNY